jgi:hypothetical protein
MKRNLSTHQRLSMIDLVRPNVLARPATHSTISPKGHGQGLVLPITSKLGFCLHRSMLPM